jgi:hypothetical protein
VQPLRRRDPLDLPHSLFVMSHFRATRSSSSTTSTTSITTKANLRPTFERRGGRGRPPHLAALGLVSLSLECCTMMNGCSKVVILISPVTRSKYFLLLLFVFRVLGRDRNPGKVRFEFTSLSIWDSRSDVEDPGDLINHSSLAEMRESCQTGSSTRSTTPHPDVLPLPPDKSWRSFSFLQPWKTC